MPKNNTAVKTEEVVIETVAPVAPKTYDVKALMETLKTKSAVIRHLHGEGLKTAEITTTMKTVFPNFIYQHARNVLNQPLKKSN